MENSAITYSPAPQELVQTQGATFFWSFFKMQSLTNWQSYTADGMTLTEYKLAFWVCFSHNMILVTWTSFCPFWSLTDKEVVLHGKKTILPQKKPHEFGMP